MTEDEILSHFAHFSVRVDSIRRGDNGAFEVRAYIPSEEGGRMGSVFFEVQTASLAPKINQQLIVTIDPAMFSKENTTPDAIAEDC